MLFRSCYIDDVGSYASNEIAINWNAPLVFVSGYFNAEGLTSVDDQGFNFVPDKFELEQNYPNPFNPSTTITWQSPVSGWQTLKVFDILGNEISTLVDEFRTAGKYEVTFSADQNIDGLSRNFITSGIYFYRLEIGDYFTTRKMVLIK